MRGSAAAQGQRRPRDQVCACAVTREGDALRVQAEVYGMGGSPAHCGHCVFERRGEPVLGAKPGVDGQHRATGKIGERTAGDVVRIEVTDNETAAMKEHHDRKGIACLSLRAPCEQRPVEPQADRTCRPGERQTCDRRHLGRRRLQCPAHLPVHAACFVGGDGVDRRVFRLCRALQELTRLRIEPPHPWLRGFRRLSLRRPRPGWPSGGIPAAPSQPETITAKMKGIASRFSVSQLGDQGVSDTDDEVAITTNIAKSLTPVPGPSRVDRSR